MSDSAFHRLHRHVRLDRHNAWIAGVCAGIAAALRTDPAFPRVAFVLAALFIPRVAIGVYLVAWIVLHQRDKSAHSDYRSDARTRRR
ncbi:MAG: PspC domain-containing protein [Gammaproteobacteria bacterium]|nr:PspC domain-containing protein [Gammaproteobacteria bacterium]